MYREYAINRAAIMKHILVIRMIFKDENIELFNNYLELCKEIVIPAEFIIKCMKLRIKYSLYQRDVLSGLDIIRV